MSQTQSLASSSVPLAVWPVSQTSSQYQRAGHYVTQSAEHPGKMVPALARKIIEEYSAVGDLVVDPMAGIGTSVVEGAAIDRCCVGIDLEQQWVDIARQNVDAAVAQDKRHLATVRVGDAFDLKTALGDDFGRVDLIVTSPPYGCDVATVDKSSPNGDIAKGKASANYSADRANLGHARGPDYEVQMRAVYQQCFDALKPGGLLVTVTKNMRRKGQLVDLAGITVGLAQSVGFGYLQHNIALLCGVRDSGLVARPSFWQTKQTRSSLAKGIPQSVVVHEDVIALVKVGDANA